MSKVLVVDDDPKMLASFEEMLADEDHEVVTATRGDDAVRVVEAEHPDLVVMDIRMPGMDGLEALERMRHLRPKLPVVIMTGYGTAEAAIEATKLGAYDYHLKPFEPADMVRSIESALDGVRLMDRRVAFGTESKSPAGDILLGQSIGMQRVYKAIGLVARTDTTVLIRGETGTGKELVARAVYQHSLRGDAPLVVVNCAAIPESLLESELFGHEKGAFTGASNRRIGKFEQADGGTILLDEIGDIPLAVQAKILRALQNKTFERVGGDTITSDVRVIASTNSELERAITEGRFREDLYHRLKVFTIEILPLRDRRDDVPRLVAHFLQRAADEIRTSPPVLSEAGMDELLSHNWPGNVRELEHCAQRLAIVARGYPIQADDVKRAIGGADTRPDRSAGASLEEHLSSAVAAYVRSSYGQGMYSGFLEIVEKRLLLEALRMTKGNQTHAAKLLGLTRPTLRAKMHKCGLIRESKVREA